MTLEEWLKHSGPYLWPGAMSLLRASKQYCPDAEIWYDDKNCWVIDVLKDGTAITHCITP